MNATFYLLLAITIASVTPIQIMLDQIKECTSNGIMECHLRVRKINRTTAAIYGNATFFIDIGSNLVSGFELFHSPLGNNQYNRYPMKIPHLDICTFSKIFWGDYYPYIAPYVPEIPKPGECPMTARLLHINDLILDGAMFPRFIPPGLWRLVWSGKEKGTDKSLRAVVIFKVFPNGFFGRS